MMKAKKILDSRMSELESYKDYQQQNSDSVKRTGEILKKLDYGFNKIWNTIICSVV